MTEQNKTVLKWVGVGFVVVLLIGALSGGDTKKNNNSNNSNNNNNYTPDTSYVAPTTVDNTAAWTTWKNGYLPTWQSFSSHYQQTINDLNNGDINAASQDYLAMSYDAVDMMQWDNSPSNTINYDVQTLAADINSMCAEGNQSLINISNGGSATYGFQGAVDAVKADIASMTVDLQNVNSGSY